MSGSGFIDLSDGITLLPYLAKWAEQTFGPRARVGGLEHFSGHSGITLGFTVALPGATSALVIKLPPFGVTQSGAMDVLEQVPVLRLMAGAAVKVPAVVDSGEAGVFPVPYVITERLPGRPSGDIFTGPLDMSATEIEKRFDQAVAELAGIHSVRPTSLRSWRNRNLTEELGYWIPVLHKAQDPEWVQQGMQLHALLRDTMPSNPQVGVVHGDYYSNNWLYDGDRLTGILDWEGSLVGATGLDVGWMCMIYDRESWGPTRRAWMSTSPSPEWLVTTYARHSGAPVEDVDWYRAAAAFRLAALTAYYLRLHRTGKRLDPVWEVFGEAFPHLVRRAIALCVARTPPSHEGESMKAED